MAIDHRLAYLSDKTIAISLGSYSKIIKLSFIKLAIIRNDMIANHEVNGKRKYKKIQLMADYRLIYQSTNPFFLKQI